MTTIQDRIIKSFDNKFGTNEAYVMKVGFVLSNEPQMKLSDIKQFLRDSIKLVQEETRKEVEEMFTQCYGRSLPKKLLSITNKDNELKEILIGKVKNKKGQTFNDWFEGKESK